ncbi:MAG: carboxypeptidase regulatory-like domain-containing protein [Vicinamibacterales bacterium]
MRRFVLGVLFVALASGAANAQQGTSELRGRVLDQQGAVLPGVTVTIRNEDTGMFRETISNADGSYFISAVTPGRYEITAGLEGFKKFVRPGVVLEVGKTQSVDVQLEIGGLEQQITVSAESPIVDTTSKEVGGHLSGRELVALPSINRNFVGILGVLPGIIPNVSTDSVGSDAIITNGRESRNNNYLLDGANNFDDVNGGRSGTQARTPLESIQEFQVITNQFDAEYGRTSGAVVNAVTKQGTNRWRGSAFIYAQDAKMTADEYFAKKQNLPKPDTQRTEMGGTIGGPIVKDKAHFFFSLERVYLDEGITINIPQRPEFNTTTVEQTRIWNTVIRFDHQINASHTWGVRWLREYSPQFNQIIGTSTLAASDEEDDTDQTVVATINSVFGNTKVNTIRFNWTNENVAFANPCYNKNGRRQDQCPVTLAYQNFTDGQSVRAQARINDAWQFDDTFSWFVPDKMGDHDVKFGAQYQLSTVANSNAGTLNGQYSFGRSNAPFDPANPYTYPDRFSIRVGGPLSWDQKIHFIGAFVQDKWKFSNRLMINAGLRYDVEIMPVPEKGNPYFANENDYPVDANNFQPRVGFTYDLEGNGRGVLRGGIGKFFERTYLESRNYWTAGTFIRSQVRNFPLNAADLGPRNGRLPTDPFLVNGPVPPNWALINQMFPPGIEFQNTGATWDHPDRRVPSSYQITIGYERQLGTNISVSADYIHNAARDLMMTRELNPNLRATPVTSQSSPVRQGSAALTDAMNKLRAQYPNFVNFTTSVTIPINEGWTNYDALQLSFEKRYSSNFSTRVSYTLSKGCGNSSGAGIPGSDFQLLDDLNLDKNERPTSEDRRHNLVISGTAIVPRTGGLTVSGVVRYLSGLPFNLTNGDFDEDRNGIIAEPLPAGTYRGNAAEDAYEVDFNGKYFGARGPSFFKLDMRVGYTFRFGGRSLELFGDIFNVTNRANFSTPSGNMQASNMAAFLNLTSTLQGNSNPRLLQLGARFAF